MTFTVNLTSTDTTGDSWNPPYTSLVQLIVWIVASLLSLETILGNAMVLLAYAISNSISAKLNNRFIVSLAISDLIIGIEGIPLFTVYVLNGDKWPLGATTCEIWLFLDYCLCLVSILTVLLITADRYLSVCHTASYLKWQTPIKMQVLIFASWLLPALIFGIMIFGWPLIGGEKERIQATTNGECYAPFLANPYVNMGMYLLYYWSTLIAMLILYKGIHKAAKKLEKRSRAKEHRHIALLLTQRLGTQVGVGLMLHAKRYHDEKKLREQMEAKQRFETKDSGYITSNTLSVADSGDRRRSSSFVALVRAVQSSQRLAHFRRGATFAARTANSKAQKEHWENNKGKQQQQKPLSRNKPVVPTVELAEQHQYHGQKPLSAVIKLVAKDSSMTSNTKGENCTLANMGVADRAEIQEEEEGKHFDSGAISLMSTDEAFNDESFSSVLNFDPFTMHNNNALFRENDASLSSDTTSQIIITTTNKQRTSENSEPISKGSEPISKGSEPISKGSEPISKGSEPISKGSEPISKLEAKQGKAMSTSLDAKKRQIQMKEQLDVTLTSQIRYSLPEQLHERLQNKAAFEFVRKSNSYSTSSANNLRVPASSAVHQIQKERDDHHCAVEVRRTSTRKNKERRTTNATPIVVVQQLDTDDPNNLMVGGILGRFFQRIHSWVRISMVGVMDGRTSTESRPDPYAGLPSFLHSSKSYSSISSVSSQDAARLPAPMALPNQLTQPQEVGPTMTVPTLTCSIWDNNETAHPIGQMPFTEHDDGIESKAARILHTIFAPISALQRRRKRTKAERRAHKAFRTITFIVGLFCILWSPYYIVATIYGFCRGECISDVLYNVSYYMCYLNSSLNPFAYALISLMFYAKHIR